MSFNVEGKFIPWEWGFQLFEKIYHLVWEISKCFSFQCLHYPVKENLFSSKKMYFRWFGDQIVMFLFCTSIETAALSSFLGEMLMRRDPLGSLICKLLFEDTDRICKSHLMKDTYSNIDVLSWATHPELAYYMPTLGWGELVSEDAFSSPLTQATSSSEDDYPVRLREMFPIPSNNSIFLQMLM